MTEPIRRYVALGDSFTEGVGDESPDSPNGCAGWADRVALALASTSPDLEYANLAVRGRLLRQVAEQQIEPALALHPDLVTIAAGGNDILRPRFEVDELADRYEAAIAKLTAGGARVVMFTTFNRSFDPLFRRLGGRAIAYNDRIRRIADRHSAVLVDFWEVSGFDDVRMWSWDRLHLSSRGHERIAFEVLRALEIEHEIEIPPLPPMRTSSALVTQVQNVQWAKSFLMPWIIRRLRGVSSGDSIAPRFPEPVPAASLSVPAPNYWQTIPK